MMKPYLIRVVSCARATPAVRAVFFGDINGKGGEVDR